MGLSRLLMLIAIIWLGWIVYRRWRMLRTRQAPPPVQTGQAQSGKTCKCAHCGVHIPAEEALWLEQRPFCCEEHRRAAQHRLPPS